MTTTVTKESLAARIAELESGPRSLKEDYTLAAYKMLLATMESEPVAWEYEWASYITCGGPQDFERIIELEAPPEWAIEKGLARNIIPLYRHAQSAPVVPVENHIGSKNALDAIVSFIKGKSNPTVKCYEEVSEQLFKDNCHGIHSHVIEYILKLGEELEDLRTEQAETQPAPVVVDEVTEEDCPAFVKYDVTGVDEAWACGFNACRAAMKEVK